MYSILAVGFGILFLIFSWLTPEDQHFRTRLLVVTGIFIILANQRNK